MFALGFNPTLRVLSQSLCLLTVKLGSWKEDKKGYTEAEPRKWSSRIQFVPRVMKTNAKVVIRTNFQKGLNYKLDIDKIAHEVLFSIASSICV